MTDKCLYIRVLYILFIRKHFRENIKQLEDVLKHRIYHRQELLDSCLKTLFSVSNNLKEYGLMNIKISKIITHHIETLENFKKELAHYKSGFELDLRFMIQVDDNVVTTSLSVLQNFLKTVRNNIGSFINFDERVMTVLRNNNVNSCKIEKN
jgi:hypothetical protein